jgi:hypothetical protein
LCSARTRFGDFETSTNAAASFDRRPPECVSSGNLVIKMERVPSQPVKDPANLVRVDPFDLDRLLSHIDPGPAEESEAYLIYEQRRYDLSSESNGETRR